MCILQNGLQISNIFCLLSLDKNSALPQNYDIVLKMCHTHTLGLHDFENIHTNNRLVTVQCLALGYTDDSV